MNQPRCKSRRRLNALCVAQMMVALQHEPTTMRELVKITGLSLHTVRGYVLTLHKMHGCYVADWMEDSVGRRYIPAFRLGRRLDVPRPLKSHGEHCREYRERLRQQGGTIRKRNGSVVHLAGE